MKRKSNLIASSTTRHRCKSAKEKVGGYFVDLPSSITTHILLQLPIKAVSICKCVCKTWNALISDPYFATLYFERASLGFMIRTADSGLVSNTLHLFEYQPENLPRVVYTKFDPKFKLPLRNVNTTCCLPSYNPEDDKFGVVNSCNGLLCLCERYNLFRKLISVNNLAVCNPITGEFIRLPEPTRITTTQKPICVGLGFQPKTNEYKVIRMWKTYDRWRCKSNVMVVEIHTLGTQTWRNIEFDPKFSSLRLECPASVNGALHWINFDSKIRSILCFNLESEKFQSFPSPPLRPHSDGITMVELKGFLYICEPTFDSCVVWLMKKYGIGESWTKVYCSDNFKGSPWGFGVCRPIKHFENGEGALLLQKTYKSDSFIYFEPEKQRSITFFIVGAESISLESVPHIPSLVSLKNVVKRNNIEVQNVHSWQNKFLDRLWLQSSR